MNEIKTFYVRAWNKKLCMWELVCIRDTKLDKVLSRFWSGRDKENYDNFEVKNFKGEVIHEGIQ